MFDRSTFRLSLLAGATALAMTAAPAFAQAQAQADDTAQASAQQPEGLADIEIGRAHV